jgi:serine/threonine protein kinase
MVFGVNLYDSMTARERIREIEKKKYFSLDKELTFNDITISKEANNFLYRVLEVDTEKRMGWRELIEHPLIKERQGPIGNRFLIKRELEEPQVDYEFKVRNSVSISLDASINNENQVNQFNSNPKK